MRETNGKSQIMPGRVVVPKMSVMPNRLGVYRVIEVIKGQAKLRNEHGNTLSKLFYPDELIVAK